MGNATLDKKTVGFGLSVAMMSIVNTLLVIVKDMTPPLKKGMADAMGHHWTTHGVIVLTLFVILGFLFSSLVKVENWNANKLCNAIVGSVILAGIGLALFYLLH
jgi:hypothetical protein